MSTRQNILGAARGLYNKKGTDAVTVRHIAAELGISHGNLCYHFLNTGTIVRQLYLDLVAELDAIIAQAGAFPPEQLRIAHVLDYTRQVFRIFHDNRFLFLDFARVMRNDQWLRKHYRGLMAQRAETFRWFFSLLRKNGLIREERVPGELELIFEMQFICADFWLARAEIMRRLPKKELIDYYVRVWLAPLPGLLTEKGLREWKTLLAGAPSPLLTLESKISSD